MAKSTKALWKRVLIVPILLTAVFVLFCGNLLLDPNFTVEKLAARTLVLSLCLSLLANILSLTYRTREDGTKTRYFRYLWKMTGYWSAIPAIPAAIWLIADYITGSNVMITVLVMATASVILSVLLGMITSGLFMRFRVSAEDYERERSRECREMKRHIAK